MRAFRLSFVDMHWFNFFQNISCPMYTICNLFKKYRFFQFTCLTFGSCAVVVPIFHSTFSISDDILPLIISLLCCILPLLLTFLTELLSVGYLTPSIVNL